MSDLLRTRVRERLDALGMNPFEAARKAGFERSFVNDLLIGKKSTVRSGKLSALARALECDPEHLTGLQGVARAGGASPGPMALAGIIKAGAWREAALGPPPRSAIPVNPDPRYPAHMQQAFIVRGDHAVDLGITDGAVIVAFTGPISYRDGDPVVVKRAGEGERYEISIRVISGKDLAAAPVASSRDADRFPASDAEIVGLVLSAHRVFGAP